MSHGLDGVSLRTRLSAAASLLAKGVQSPVRSAPRFSISLNTTSYPPSPQTGKVLLHGGERSFGLRARAAGWCGGASRHSTPDQCLARRNIPRAQSKRKAIRIVTVEARVVFACIVYEMIWGHPPFRGTGELASEPPGICRTDAALLPVARHSAWFGRGRVTRACQGPGAPVSLGRSVCRGVARRLRFARGVPAE